MKYNLNSVGIYTDERYECIYTTINSAKEKNSAAIGLKYLGEDKVACRIFEGSKTLTNIMETKQYVVNITQDPLIFTKSTIDSLPEEYYTDDEDIAILKDAGSYIIVEAESIEELSPEDTPIKKGNGGYLIKGKIKDFIINNEMIKAYNRGFSALIECLVNYTRYNIVDDMQKEYYLGRVKENKRMINRIGNEKTKYAMDLIEKEYKKS